MCQWNPYGVGPNECEPEEYCGGTGEQQSEMSAEECIGEELSESWCEQMCEEPYEGADWDLNCNGWSDWDDCDFYYGECNYIAPKPLTLTASSLGAQLAASGLLIPVSLQVGGHLGFCLLWLRRRRTDE